MALFGKDYDSVKIGGEFTALPANGYVCVIKKARMTTNGNGLPMIEVPIDISEGEYAHYFTQLFRERMSKDPNSKYPYNGILKITAVDENGNTKKNFKSFCTAVEQSNGIVLPRNDDGFLQALVGMEVGVLYQREEYLGNDGNAHWSTKPKWFRSTESIRKGRFTVPEDVPLPDTYGTGFESADSFNAASDDLPF